MAKQIILTQNDYGIELETQFINDKKKPLDITDYDVRVKIIYNNETIDTILARHKDNANGIAYIVLEKEHLLNAGLYTTVWSVVNEDEHITAQENLYYFVKDVEGSEDDTPTTDLPIDADSIINKFKEFDDNLFELNEQKNIFNEAIDVTSKAINNINKQLDNIYKEKEHFINVSSFLNGTIFTIALQNAINYAYENNIGKVIIPAGKFEIEKPIYLYDRIKISGSGCYNTTLFKNNDIHGEGIYYNTNAIFILKKFNDSQTEEVADVIIDNLVLDTTLDKGNNIYGIYSRFYLSLSTISNVKFKNIDYGIRIKKGSWIINMVNLHGISNKIFIQALAESGATTLHLENCYSWNASEYGFYLQGGYSSANNLACDACTGICYYFSQGEWSINGLGIESKKALKGLKLDNIIININGLNLFGISENENSIMIDTAGTEVNGNFSGVIGSNRDSNGMMINGGINCNLEFRNCKIGNFKKPNKIAEYCSITIDGYKQEQKLQYLGTHRRTSGNKNARAIFTNIHTNKHKNSANESLSYELTGGLGDVYLFDNPLKTGCVGMVNDTECMSHTSLGQITQINGNTITMSSMDLDTTAEYGTRWYKGARLEINGVIREITGVNENTKILALYGDISMFRIGDTPRLAKADTINATSLSYIPTVQANVSSRRPTDCPTGFLFFDITLNKPIWWTGYEWVDATGRTV